MTEKQKEVLERVCEAIEPLDDEQLEDFLKVGDGMVIMKNIMTGKSNTEKVS